ncbi:MAG: DinB family protein [Thermoanaerobaculia bacterium]
MSEREALIGRYERGAELILEALERVPGEARMWRPEEGRWSVHEVVWHCADAELVGASRLRYLLAEPNPILIAFDQDLWATVLDYHALPIETALETLQAVRRSTVAILRNLPDDAFGREGRHTEVGPMTVLQWLESYAGHLEDHARQIERNLEAWNKGPEMVASA